MTLRCHEGDLAHIRQRSPLPDVYDGVDYRHVLFNERNHDCVGAAGDAVRISIVCMGSMADATGVSSGLEYGLGRGAVVECALIARSELGYDSCAPSDVSTIGQVV